MATPVETRWIEWATLVLSPQLVIGLVALFFLGYFRNEIRFFIRNVRGVKLPGIEFSTQQQKLEEQPKTPEAVALPKEPTLQELSLNREQMDQIEKYFEAERAAGRIWEYRYLNYFLAPITQVVLDWLVSVGHHTTISAAEAYWMPVISDASERNAILDALQLHVLVQIKGQLISVTEKGKEYAAWPGRKVLSAPPAAAPLDEKASATTS